jgi:hypothetical protein
MNTSKAFKNFWNDLHSKFPEEFKRKFEESDINIFGELFTKNVFDILQKDESMWDEPKVLFDVDLSDIWKREESSHEIIWRNLKPCGIEYILHQDFSEKFKDSVPILASVLKQFTNKKSQIDELLEEETNHSKITDFFNFLKDLKIVSYFFSLFQEFDISEIDIECYDLNDMTRNLDKILQDPKIQKIQQNLKSKLEEKVKNGEISKQVIASDIEKIKQKVTELFGDIFNDILGGRKSEVKASTILSNTPEARRERMIARLQRKLKERK